VVFRIFSIIRDDRSRFVRAYNKAVLASTFVTIPVLAGLIVAAPEFIVAAFGDQWVPAVLPFRLLCLAAVFRFMSGNATAVVQASGQIWSEVWRRVVYVALMVTLLFLFRRWGIAGAAVGVLAATVLAVLLMQGLVGRILGLNQWELVRPLVPGITCALGVATVVGVVTAICRSALPGAPEWVVFGLQTTAGGVFWGLFSLFGRFRSLQEVVGEVVEDVFPKPLRRLVQRFR
jgi:O-antigen/teichoic acid export membrane protein